jgi:hypothetical protein
MQNNPQAWVQMSRFGNFKSDVDKIEAYLDRDYPGAIIHRHSHRRILVVGISPVDLATGQYLFWPFNGKVLS